MRISDWSSDVCSSDLLAAYNDDGLAGAKADDRVPDADLAPRIRLFDLTRHTRFTLLLAPQTEAEREAAEAFAANVAKRWPQGKMVNVLPKGSDAYIRDDVFVDTAVDPARQGGAKEARRAALRSRERRPEGEERER